MPDFKKQYQARGGIEGTISQAVRVTKLRKARYRGLIKTRLQHYATASAINILRLGAWWLGREREQTRRSPFLALAPQTAVKLRQAGLILLANSRVNAINN